MNCCLSTFAVLGLFFTLLASSASSFAEECTWQNKYRVGGYQAFRQRSTSLQRERPSEWRTNPRVSYLQGKRASKTISSSETIELNVLESGGSPRQGLLAVKKHEGHISQKEAVELNALETTKSPRVALLAVKKFDGSITPAEKVELETLNSTNSPRQALLAVAKFEGKLKDDEKVELEALERSGGDVLYANLAVKKFKGEKLTECETQELSFIEKSVSTPNVVVPVPGGAAR